MKIRSIIFFLSLVLSQFSCRETLDIDLEEAEPRIAVFALLTNQEGPYKVQISRTKSFYSTEDQAKVQDAVVTLSDNFGESELLIETEPGIYETQNFQGRVGRMYTLTIQAEGQTYTSQSELKNILPVDSIKFRYYDQPDLLHQRGYYPVSYAKTPPGETNYYLWKFYRNDTLLHNKNQLFIAEDRFVQENINGLEGPFVYQLGDKLRIESFSLTKEAYDFYLHLQNQLNNDGGFFSGPPANPQTNIHGGALGVFQVSGMEIDELIVE
ncbi:MAG: DUF4249 domain-containing protein [Cytophagaceae bacterium]